MYSGEKPPPYSPIPPAMNQPVGYQDDSVLPPTVTQPTGFQSVPQSVMPNYGSTVYVQQIPPPTQVVFVGGCPACRVGVLEDDFTCLGVCLAIFCFPIGILCCLALKQRRCPNCGAIYG